MLRRLVVLLTAFALVGGYAGAASPTKQAFFGHPPMAYRNIASRGQLPIATNTASSPKLELQGRTKFKVWYSTKSVRFHFMNMELPSSAGPGTVTINKCAIEQGSNFWPITFAGAVGGVTLATSGAGAIVESDNSTVDLVPGLAWARCDYTVTTSGYAYGKYYNSATTEAGSGGGVEQGLIFDPANTIDQIYSTGALAVPTGATNTFPIAPVEIIGLVPSYTQSWCGGVTSIEDGKLDFASSSGIDGGGYMRRAAYLASKPYVSFALTGMRYDQMNSTNGQAMLTALAQYCTNVFYGGPTNDVFNNESLSTIQTTMASFWNIKTRAGSSVRRIVQGDLFPRVTCTVDHCTTLANQVNNLTGFSSGGVADQWDTYTATLAGTNKVDSVFLTRTTLADASDAHFWASTGFTPTLFTTTLSASALTTDSVLHMTAAPTYGMSLIIAAGTANMVPITSSTNQYAPTAVSGTGPYSVTFSSAVGVAQSNGASVTQTLTEDGTHISGTSNIFAATVMNAAQ